MNYETSVNPAGHAHTAKGHVGVAGAAPPSCAAKATGTAAAAAAAGAKPAQPLVTAPLKDPLAQGFKATAVIGISCKVCMLCQSTPLLTSTKLPTVSFQVEAGKSMLSHATVVESCIVIMYRVQECQQQLHAYVDFHALHEGVLHTPASHHLKLLLKLHLRSSPC